MAREILFCNSAADGLAWMMPKQAAIPDQSSPFPTQESPCFNAINRIRRIFINTNLVRVNIETLLATLRQPSFEAFSGVPLSIASCLCHGSVWFLEPADNFGAHDFPPSVDPLRQCFDDQGLGLARAHLPRFWFRPTMA